MGAAIDVWSVGVILLTLLTRRYPFFQSSDDLDALAELACLFGNRRMREVAQIYDRTWHCNIPSVPEDPVPWPTLCGLLNSSWADEIPPEAFDLLSLLLDPDYNTRPSAESLLSHPFLTNW